MIKSLRENGDYNKVVVLGLDEDVLRLLPTLSLGDVEVVDFWSMCEFEPRLEVAAKNRSKFELYFTTTPLLITFVLKKFSDFKYAIYLDSDLYFFENPQLVIDAMSSKDVGIIPHRHSWPNQRRLAKYGTYNVGWVGFKNTPGGHEVALWWKDRCLEWCLDKPSLSLYADQGYLDFFPLIFATRVQVIRDRGMNLAPWNSSAVKVQNRNGRPQVSGENLVFFHFHALKKQGNRWYFGEHLYYSLASLKLRKLVYKPYILELLSISSQISGQTNFTARSWGKQKRPLAGFKNTVLSLLFQSIREKPDGE